MPPPDERRQTNRTRRPTVRKSPRAPFPLITAAKDEEAQRRAAAVRRGAAAGELDTDDPAAGGGRSFSYEWENRAQVIEQQIQDVAAGGGIAYVHHQSVPAASWVIDHHMGLIPNVLVLDTSGTEILPELRFPSDQTVVVVHSKPYTGTAYLRP